MDQYDDIYLPLKELTRYSGLSLSFLKTKLRGDNPIPYYNTGGKILVKRSEFDKWMEQYRITDSVERVSKLGNQILANMIR